MRSLIGAVALATIVVVAPACVTSAAAAPPVATPSPGYDARLSQTRATDVSSARRRHHRRARPTYVYGEPGVYYGPRVYRPYYYRPYYYRPYYAPAPFVPFYGFGFGFGW